MPKINTTSILYDRMAQDWGLIHDLLGGTRAMRASSTTWLTQEPKEDAKSYQARLGRSILYNAYKDTLKRLLSKPFSKPVTIENMIERLSSLETNIDKIGTSLSMFARNIFEAGINYGLAHIIIDFPKTEDPTLASENILIPTWILVTPPQLIAWTSEVTNDGKRFLTSIRVLEIRIESFENYKEEEVEYIRVYTRTDWELWKKSEGEFQRIDSGQHSFGEVPLITFYVSQTDYMTGEPALLDLAWLNLAHWQSSSDQRNILRFSRMALLVALGFSEEEMEKISIGPNRIIHSSSTDATFGYAEHTGKAIGTGEADLKALEERMEVLGLQPMIARTAKSTATGKLIDENRVMTDIQAWISNLEQVLRLGFEFSAKWLDLTLPDNFSINIFSDFTSGVFNSSVSDLLNMRKTIPAQITHTTFLNEMKRRSILSENLDVELEIEEVKNEDIFGELDGTE